METLHPKWIVDKYIFESCRIPFETFKDLGIEVFEYDYIPFLVEDIRIPFDQNDPVVVYTTLNAVNKCKGFFGCYYDDHNYNCNVYMSLLDVEPNHFLNHDHLYCTLSDLMLNPEFYFNMLGSDRLFIRPNKGNKEFTGNVWSVEELPREIDAIIQMYGVDKHAMLLLSTPKKIFDEARFIIGDRKILASSRYMVRGQHKEDLEVNAESIQLVENILDTSRWLPSSIFVIDVATTESGPKIVEINSFSCSGWYAMDPREVILKVSELVMREYEREFE